MPAGSETYWASLAWPAAGVALAALLRRWVDGGGALLVFGLFLGAVLGPLRLMAGWFDTVLVLGFGVLVAAHLRTFKRLDQAARRRRDPPDRR